MIKDLEEYYQHITYINDRLAEYEDSEGNLFAVTPSNLLVAVQYQALTKQEYEQAVFNQLVPKDIICKEIEIDKIVPKNEITHNDKDKFILTTIKQKAKEVWFVSNGLGIRKAYNEKEEDKKLQTLAKELILSLAYGYARSNHASPYHELFEEADKMLYENKKIIKEKYSIPNRSN